MIRHFLKGILLIGVVFWSVKGNAQDIHFSQYNASPLQLNPSMAGLNTGDYRVYANFRMQWLTISNGPTYRTLAAGGDIAVGKVTKYNSFAGIGLSLYSDQAGALNYGTNRITGSFAYHFMLNKNGTQQLSAGLQGSFNYRSINPGNATFDQQYNPITGAVDLTTNAESFGRTKLVYGDAGLGLLYSGFFKNNLNFYTGFALDHVNQPRISFFPSSQTSSEAANERLYMKITFHGGLAIPVSPRISILPSYVLFVQGPAYEFDLGGSIKSLLGDNVKSSNTSIYFGAQYRGLFDAVILSTRIDYKGFSGGLSYDVNISKLLPASKSIGAPEISITYTGMSRKKPRPGHCPVMM